MGVRVSRYMFANVIARLCVCLCRHVYVSVCDSESGVCDQMFLFAKDFFNVCICVCVCVCVYEFVFLRMRMCVCMYMCMYIYVYIYIYIV